VSCPVLTCRVWCLCRHGFDPIGRTGGGVPVRHLRAAKWRTGSVVLCGYELKAKMVIEVKVLPAPSSVEGKLGWLGEFGKCWVSNV
jgi:hypothetical protein